MKAIILLATLKKNGRSNTETLHEFFGPYIDKQNIEYEVIKLANHNIVPGTHTYGNKR
jgi:multimeric flavodoxin WrbA